MSTLLSVSLKFFGYFIELAGTKELNIEADNTMTVGDLINKIEETGKVDFKKSVVDFETHRLRDNVMLMLNARDITHRQGLDTPVNDKDELHFYPISLGG